MDGDEATTNGSLVGAAHAAQGNGWIAEEEKKRAVEKEEVGEGHEPYT